MAKQRIINTRLWNDSWVSSLDPIEKLLFVYLLTNEHTDISGVYELPIKIMAVETSIERENLEKVLLPRFQKAEKVLYRDGWVAIKNFIKHQNLNPKVQAGIQIGLDKAPNDLRAFLEDSLPIAYDSLSHSNSNSNSNSNTSSNSNTYLSRPTRKSENPSYSETFIAFWSSYPKKVGKGDAWRAWSKIAPSQSLAAKIVASVKDHIDREEQWKRDNGRYIPNPATFLNQRRWEDEIATDLTPAKTFTKYENGMRIQYREGKIISKEKLH